MEKNILLPVRQFHIKAAATRGVVFHTDFPLMGSNDLLCDAETKAKMLPVAGERFINQHGLAARELQWNYRYGWKWLAEMVPAKWSDFEGWRENFQKHKKAVELVKNTEKSTIESEGIRYYDRKILFELSGILFCGLCVRNIWYIIRKVLIL